MIVLLLLALAAPAFAGTVSAIEDQVRFGGTDRRDAVTIVPRGDGFRVTSNRKLNVRKGCERRARSRAFCRKGPLEPFLVNVKLHAGDDVLTARVLPEGEGDEFDLVRAEGGPGADTLAGRADTLVFFLGGIGDDMLSAGPKSNKRIGSGLRGGPGDDTLTGGAGPAFMYGGPDDDTIDAHGGPDNEIDGNGGDDVLRLNEGAGAVNGGDGDDRITTGRGGNSAISGGPGDDTIDAAAGPGRDRIGCGPGFDTVTLGSNDVLDDDAACEIVNRV